MVLKRAFLNFLKSIIADIDIADIDFAILKYFAKQAVCSDCPDQVLHV